MKVKRVLWTSAVSETWNVNCYDALHVHWLVGGLWCNQCWAVFAYKWGIFILLEHVSANCTPCSRHHNKSRAWDYICPFTICCNPLTGWLWQRLSVRHRWCQGIRAISSISVALQAKSHTLVSKRCGSLNAAATLNSVLRRFVHFRVTSSCMLRWLSIQWINALARSD